MPKWSVMRPANARWHIPEAEGAALANGAANIGLGRPLASVQCGVERGADNTGLRLFSVADLAGFVNVLAGQADLGGGRLIIPVWNIYRLTNGGNLAARLCRVILIGNAAVGEGFDLKRIRLRVIGFGDDLVERALCLE